MNNLTLHRYQRTNKRYTEDLGDGVKLPLMLIPAGQFWMGQTEAETAELKRQVSEEDYQRYYARELPRHQVTVPSFFMCKTPVTQAQYVAVMGTNPAEQYDSDRFVAPEKPVVGVSWDDAVAFCKRLAERTDKDYRLPTEAEWEYACRAETQTPFYFGKTLTTEVANYDGNDTYADGPKGEFRNGTIPVDLIGLANRFGLSDMHGNVWEWCEDDYHDSYEGAPEDGSAWVDAERSKTSRILRGDSWDLDPRDCRSAFRIDVDAVLRVNHIGFRLCCAAPRLSQ